MKKQGKWSVYPGIKAIFSKVGKVEVVVHTDRFGNWYGLLGPVGFYTAGGFSQGWSLRKAKRKALKKAHSYQVYQEVFHV